MRLDGRRSHGLGLSSRLCLGARLCDGVGEIDVFAPESTGAPELPAQPLARGRVILQLASRVYQRLISVR